MVQISSVGCLPLLIWTRYFRLGQPPAPPPAASAAPAGGRLRRSAASLPRMKRPEAWVAIWFASRRNGPATRAVDSSSRARLLHVWRPSSNATGFARSTAAKSPKRSGAPTIPHVARRSCVYAEISRPERHDYSCAAITSSPSLASRSLKLKKHTAGGNLAR